MARKAQTLTIAQSADELLAQDRHTDWVVAHAQGRTRNGRAYLGHRVHGTSKTKQGQSKTACRGRVDY
jgi:hypothetical protein